MSSQNKNSNQDSKKAYGYLQIEAISSDGDINLTSSMLEEFNQSSPDVKKNSIKQTPKKRLKRNAQESGNTEEINSGLKKRKLVQSNVLSIHIQNNEDQSLKNSNKQIKAKDPYGNGVQIQKQNQNFIPAKKAKQVNLERNPTNPNEMQKYGGNIVFEQQQSLSNCQQYLNIEDNKLNRILQESDEENNQNQNRNDQKSSLTNAILNENFQIEQISSSNLDINVEQNQLQIQNLQIDEENLSNFFESAVSNNDNINQKINQEIETEKKHENIDISTDMLMKIDQNDIDDEVDSQNDQVSQEEINFENQIFTNQIFRILYYQKKQNYQSNLELKLCPNMDQYGQILDENFVECPILFKLTMLGSWSKQTWIDMGDFIRVIGEFRKENQFHLLLNDPPYENQPGSGDEEQYMKASMIIVEPQIMIPTTQIVNAFPCVRKAYLSNQFKGMSGDVNYPLVLGNIVHAIFQSILACMDFRIQRTNEIIKKSIQTQLLILFSLKKTEFEVQRDAKRAVKNITEWLDMVLRPGKNQHGVLYKDFIAAEQEFNTLTYGIKGNIDATIKLKDRTGAEKVTALEIKTGKNKRDSYRGQVIIYSLLISERFVNSNPDNILLYIMDNNLNDGFDILKQRKMELDSLIMGRNELAKWYKLNSKKFDVPFINKNENKKNLEDEFNNFEGKDKKLDFEDQYGKQVKIIKQDNYDNIKVVHLPPMINRVQECKSCFSKEVCSLAAISLEGHLQRKQQCGQFQTFQEIQQRASQNIRDYFKKYFECINLEQSAEMDRQSSQYSINMSKETNLKIKRIYSNNEEGVMVTLQKAISDSKTSELNERQYVNLKTKNNISFGKGFIITRAYFFKSNKHFDSDGNPIQIQENNPEIQQFLNNQQNNKQNQMQQLPSDFNLKTSKDLAKQFNQFIEYVVEFAHIMPGNISQDAMGGKDPYQLDWTLEIEPFSTFSYSVMRNNILQLSINERYSQMRDSIIYMISPKNPELEQIEKLQKAFKDDLSSLNEEQQVAVLKSVLSNNYHMVLGTPGSGKTTAIVVLIQILAKLKKRVLVVSFTNSAIDNVLSRLKSTGFNNFIRVTNNIASVDDTVQQNVKTYKMFESMNQIQQTLDQNYIYGTTCLQMNNNLLLCLKFDYCIMDEASQISEPLAVGPILLAEKFIMIGDYYQLNPLVKSNLADKKGMGMSLFEKLCKKHPRSATVLKKQYRMNNDILELSNSIIYHGVMTHGDEQVSCQKVIFPREVNSMLTWLEEIKKRSVIFLKTDRVITSLKIKERQRYRYKNFIEAALCAMIIDNFKHCGVDSNSITIITPFLDQQILLKSHLSMYNVKQVLTIDKAQGIDCDIVIISCTKQTADKGVLLKDLKRLNVALTRAKKKLILIGTHQYLKEINPLGKILEKMTKEGWEQELMSFDDQLKSYLPKETKKFLSIDDLGQ